MNLDYTVRKSRVLRLYEVRGPDFFPSAWKKAIVPILILSFVSVVFISQICFEHDAAYCCLYLVLVVLLIILGLHIICVRRVFRRNAARQIEYRLTDETLSFTSGDVHFSAPWSKVAKKFKIDKDAICLYGKDVPLEARYIPDWKGRGVKRAELDASLKKAGLEKAGLGSMVKGNEKLLLKFLAAVLGPPSLLTFYFFVGGIEGGNREIFDEGALRLQARVVPDEENVLEALFALTNLCSATRCNDAKGREDLEFIGEYADSFRAGPDDGAKKHIPTERSDAGSRERAEKILAEHEPFFKGLHAALSRKGYFDKERAAWGDDVKKSYDRAGFPVYMSFRPKRKCFVDFALFAKLKAQVALEDGDAAMAFSAIEDIHDLGLTLSTNACGMVDSFVGALIRKIACQKICDAVAMGRMSEGMLRHFEKILAADEACFLSIWDRAVRMEIARLHLELIQAVRHADGVCQFINLSHAVMYREWRHRNHGVIFSWPGYYAFSLHRRKTISRLSGIVRAALDGTDWPEYFLRVQTQPDTDGVLEKMRPNWLGDFAIPKLLPLFEKYIKEDKLNWLRLRLVLAAAKWRKANGGKNPPSLEALVPKYLAAVPTDPWSKTGEPMRYDAELEVVWSVGEGGDYDYRRARNRHQFKDKTLKYTFRIDAKASSIP